MLIFWLLGWSFFKIGLFAIGGGLVTVPFLFDLAEQYNWFTARELTDMIAISQITPGPVGINMATYAGYHAAGINGAFVATFCEILPSMIIVYIIANMLTKWSENKYLLLILQGIRPAVLALILSAGWNIAGKVIMDVKTVIFLVLLITVMRFYRKSIILYIFISAIIGVVLQI